LMELMLWWRGAGITPPTNSHIEHTTQRCSYKLNGISAKEITVIDGSSHFVIKSSVSYLISRGREKLMPFLWHDVPFSHSIP
jgi:hypothetical protein